MFYSMQPGTSFGQFKIKDRDGRNNIASDNSHYSWR